MTWRYFQRARHGVFGALGGENSSGARAIQASLRRVGGGLRATERTRSPVTGPAPHRATGLAQSTLTEPVRPTTDEPSGPEPAPAVSVPLAAAESAIELAVSASLVSPAAELPVLAPPEPMSPTSCVLPWTQLIVRPDGLATFCCDVPDPLTVGGRLGDIATDRFEDLWNAPELVGTRAAMARGERPAGCAVCWKREAEGTMSRRIQMNQAYRQAGGALDVDTLPIVGADTGYRLDRAPSWFILDLGNTCNLKCRSCSPTYSSSIGADQVHRTWIAQDQRARDANAAPAGPLPEGANAWFRDVDRTADMIAAGAHENALLTLMGGEPFLIKQTWQLLEALTERGVAKNIFVGLSTNGQWRSKKLVELARHFRGFNVSVSIDGHGPTYEYLRHGASWERLLETLDWLTGLEGVSVAATPTLQNVNALEMVPMFRMFDSYELQTVYNVVTYPARLSPTNLPPNVRQAAVERLDAYLASECREVNANVVRGYSELLSEPGDAFDEELFAEFMTFTNDLDASRGERLADVAPELIAMLGEAGITWSDAHVHHVPVNGATNGAVVAAP